MFDLVVLDSALPEGKGAHLMALVHQHAPEAAIVRVSALTDLQLIRNLLFRGPAEHSNRPFDLMAFYKRINHHLAA
ncbi:hypothetical protein GCM10008938_52010 [Deinococcus roseus]|uniref:Response regulatory domain-containing protein n=2 Tax=Deinococcus roseus TaxID=392414 RepID=A0ABQ2DIS8_9DEIO|nr:hypothetical protein GCM10008938_52010 [Deinococcus roseus]